MRLLVAELHKSRRCACGHGCPRRCRLGWRGSFRAPNKVEIGLPSVISIFASSWGWKYHGRGGGFTAAGVPRRANPNPILRVTQFIKGFQEYQDFIEDDMIVCVQEEASVIRVRRPPAPAASHPSTPCCTPAGSTMWSRDLRCVLHSSHTSQPQLRQ